MTASFQLPICNLHLSEVRNSILMINEKGQMIHASEGGM